MVRCVEECNECDADVVFGPVNAAVLDAEACWSAEICLLLQPLVSNNRAAVKHNVGRSTASRVGNVTRDT